MRGMSRKEQKEGRIGDEELKREMKEIIRFGKEK